MPGWTEAGFLSATVAGLATLAGIWIQTRSKREEVTRTSSADYARVGVEAVQWSVAAAVERERHLLESNAELNVEVSRLRKELRRVQRLVKDDEARRRETAGRLARVIDELDPDRHAHVVAALEEVRAAVTRGNYDER